MIINESKFDEIQVLKTHHHCKVVVAISNNGNYLGIGLRQKNIVPSLHVYYNNMHY